MIKYLRSAAGVLLCALLFSVPSPAQQKFGVNGPQNVAVNGQACVLGSSCTISTAETRTLQTSIIEPTTTGSPDPIAAGSTATLFSATGPGSVERIQFASIPGLSLNSTTLTITVDGTSYTVPIGIFFLTYGYDDTTANAHNFATKNLAITGATNVTINTTYPNPDGSCCAANASMLGVYRKIYIPFQNSLSIVWNNTTGSSAQLFTQVDYYMGAPPIGLHPSTQKVFHIYTSTSLSTTLAAYGTLNWLPQVNGAGQLDSIYFFVLGIAAGSSTGNGGLPLWLEGDPQITVDGSKTTGAGGTEDFFGCQFYCTGFETRVDEYGVGLISSSISNQNTYTSFYRYFHDTPLIFNSSIAATWQNGQTNEPGGSSTPPAVNYSVMVVYYTTN